MHFEAVPMSLAEANEKVFDLKPCPCCGGAAKLHYCAQIDEGSSVCIFSSKKGVHCTECGLSTLPCGSDDEAIERWNRRVSIETALFDEERTIPNCTVQILRNSVTGEESVVWWRENE